MVSLFFVLISIIYYIFSPEQYSPLYVKLVTFTFLLQTIAFVYKKSKNHYLNFYFLFFISYYFINFFYPSILYPINPEYFSVFTLSTFDVSLINKATSLAFVSSSFLILGAETKLSSSSSSSSSSKLIFNHFNVTIVSALIVLAFIATVGKTFLRGDFTAHSTISLYILQIALYTLTITSVVFLKDFKHQRNKKIFYIVILVFTSVFLIVGDRGPALSILLAIASLYTYHIKRLKFITIIASIFFGIIFMHLIGEGRSTSPTVDNTNILAKGLESFKFNIDSLYNLSQSFVVNTFTLYAGIDYTHENGLNYGSTLLTNIVSLFPFLLSLIASVIGTSLVTSEQVLTVNYLGPNPLYGLGTNLISDVYMSFGFGGCIISFYLIGLFVEKVRKELIIKNTIPLNITYFTLVSLAIVWPRAGYLMPLKPIIWSIVIYHLLRSLYLLKSIRN